MRVDSDLKDIEFIKAKAHANLAAIYINKNDLINAEIHTNSKSSSGSLTVRIIFPPIMQDSSVTSISSISSPPPYPPPITSYIEVAEYLIKNNKILLRLFNNSDKEEHIALLYRVLDFKTGEVKKEFLINDIIIESFSMIRVEMPEGDDNDLHLTSLIKESEILHSLALRK